jgi:hypothetical protein
MADPIEEDFRTPRAVFPAAKHVPEVAAGQALAGVHQVTVVHRSGISARHTEKAHMAACTGRIQVLYER